jgi:trimeric autotransporter adhesin
VLPKHPTTSLTTGRNRRRLIAAGVCLLVAAVAASSAGAYVTASGYANASANVGTLVAPTITAATPGAGTVALTWSSVAAPAGGSVKYYVTRTGGTAGGTCPSSAAAATTSTSCTDSGLTKGSYSYTVTAVWQSWSSTGAATPVTVGSGALARFAVSAPASATAGAFFPVTVTAQDAAGNTVVADTGSTSVSFSGPSSAPNGTAPTYPSSVNFSSGVGTASVTLYDVQSTTLTATQGSIAGTSASLTVGAGANHQIAASAGSAQTAGTAFNVALTAQDAWGNPTGTLSGTATVSFSGPANSPKGTAPSYPATVRFSGGAATASVTLTDAQTATLTVSDTTDGLPGVPSGNVAVGPGSAGSLGVATPAPTAGTAFSETLTALDAYGNTATAYTGSKTVTFSGPASSPGGTAPSYPASVSFSNGVASPSLTLYDAQTTTLTATQGTVAGVSGSFTISPGSAAALVFTTQPAGVTAGFPFTTQPVVIARDGYGNVATGYAKTVALSIKSGTGPTGASLTGCTSSLSAGVTTFSGCQVSLSGSGYVLNAGDGTLTVASTSFTAASPTTVTKTTAGTYTLTVPAGVTSFTFTMKGAGGGGGRSGAAGGAGGVATGTITIPASITSTTLTVVVGGAGAGSTGLTGGAAGTGGTGCALGGSGGSGTSGGGGGGGGATCVYLSGAPANTIVTVGGGGGGSANTTSSTGGAGGGGPTGNPGSSTGASAITVSGATGGAGGSTLTAGSFPFAITNTGGAGGTGSSSSGGTGGTCSGGACGPGGTGGGGATYGAGGGGGGEASGGAGGAGRSGATNFAAGGGGGSAYTGGTQSSSKNYSVIVSAASNGGGSAGGAASASGTSGSASFTGAGLTLA